MKKTTVLTCLLLISMFFIKGCSDNAVVNNPGTSFVSVPASSFSSGYAVSWSALVYRVLSDQQPNPPKCARIYSYVSVAIYESVINGIPNGRSLSGQLLEMPAIPPADPGLKYDWPSVIAASVPKVLIASLDSLFPSSNVLINNLQQSQYDEREDSVGTEIFERSKLLGTTIADKIIEWKNTDKYTETRSMTYFPPPRTQNPAFWEPINPGDMALEPYWKLIRPFALDNFEAVAIHYPYTFDTIPGGPVYEEAIQVNSIAANLTEDQKQTAVYWNDKLRTATPTGHWFAIADQVMETMNLKLDRVSQVYAILGVTSRDAFIQCWKGKYDKNFLRPETYIRDYINKDFYAYIQTPSFPEYTSGHSTISGACAEVLTQMLGSFQFTDRTHVPLGYGERTYTNFHEAASEAGISRLYGGIHFNSGNVNGTETGKRIAQYVINRINLHTN